MHDLPAFLAERMTEINKRKHQERRIVLWVDGSKFLISIKIIYFA